MNALALVLTLSLLPLTADVPGEEPAEKEPPSLLGEVSREQLEAAEPEWVAAQVESEVDAEAARALAAVEPGARLTIYLGTWCSDSKREVSRFWAALDEAGTFDVDVHYMAVDRGDKRPPELKRDIGLYWVPTFIVERDGREVGRVVEVAPDAIERDLLALLTNEARGVLTAREDGAAPPSDEPSGDEPSGEESPADGPARDAAESADESAP